MKYPPLYTRLLRGLELSPKTFLLWVSQSIYQGFIIVLIAVWSPLSWLEQTAVTFTALIFTELLNVISEITRLNRVVALSCVGSVAIYLVSVNLLPELFETTPLTFQFMQVVILILSINWLPLYIGNKLLRKFYPSEDQKLMEQDNIAADAQGGGARQEGCFGGLMAKFFKPKHNDIDSVKKEFELN